jgi:two-component system cell cycle sensor histidine kinase/response regulator CckA
MQPTVLFVDDNREIRKLICPLLAERGYRVLEAPDGLSAYEMAQAFPDFIDLLVTDVTMPRMDGPELSLHLRELRPAIKVLFISGASKPPNAEGAFLPKPFTPRTLLQRLETLLGAAPVKREAHPDPETAVCSR